MNILVTGGAGFIGSNLVKELVKSNKVTILDNLSSGSIKNIEPYLDRIEFIKGSILDKDLLTKVCKNIDVIFHLAAMVSVDDSVKNPIETNITNLHGTLNLLDIASKSGVKRFIFSSSAAVYGDTDKLPIDEGAQIRPMSPYALQKYSSEQYCNYYNQYCGLETVCLRYFNVYGPNQKENSGYAGVIYRFISNALSDRKIVIHGDGLQTRDFIFVDDVVAANIAAMNAKSSCTGKAYNIGNAKEISILDLYTTICKILAKDVVKEEHKKREGDISRSLANINMAKQGLGFTPKTGLHDGLVKTIEWIKTNEKNIS